jgi:hypothetical protein
MSETAKNARTNKTANDIDDSKIRLYELVMHSMELCLLMMPLLMLIKAIMAQNGY